MHSYLIVSQIFYANKLQQAKTQPDYMILICWQKMKNISFT